MFPQSALYSFSIPIFFFKRKSWFIFFSLYAGFKMLLHELFINNASQEKNLNNKVPLFL